MSLFRLNPNDRNSAIVLLLVIMVSAVLIPVMCNREDGEDSKNANNSREAKATQYYDQGSNSTTKGELFPFDPNTADSTTLLRLGLQPWQVRNIYKYRAKGGRYRKPTDFAKLYGLTLEHYKRLEPYIRIEPEKMARDYINDDGEADDYGNNHSNHYERNVNATNSEAGTRHDYAKSENPKLRPGQTVDINTADTTQLKRIPGIGSYYARRIVELRQRRGAFVSAEELLTIRNFPETALTYITVSQNFPKIHINKASQKELQAHPLINYVQARDIMNLRRLTGNISSAEQLSSIPSFTTASLTRLTPFLIFD